MRQFTINFVALIVLMGIGQANAGTLSFGLDTEYTGGVAPEGTTPWLTATFDDGGIAGTVELTLDGTNLTGTEFVDEWLFNLDPTLDPTALSFSTTSTTGSFADPAIHTGVDAFHAGGDGLFDLQFVFANSGGIAERFGMGDRLVTEISGIGTLTAASFDFGSALGGSFAGPLRSVAHIQAIGADSMDSGWISAPEPSSIALSVIGLFTLLAFVSRRGSAPRRS